MEVLRNMRKEGKHPLSKVPHLGDPELDNYVPQSSAAEGITPLIVGSDKESGVCVDVEEVTEGVAEVVAVAVTEGVAVTEAVTEGVAGLVSTGDDIVTEVEPACSSSSSTPPLAPITALDGNSSIRVIAIIATIAKTEVGIGSEKATHATEKESIIHLDGIEGEIGRRAEDKVEVEVEAGAMAMTLVEGIPQVEVQGGSETDKEYLVRTCRYVLLDSILYAAFYHTSLHPTPQSMKA